MSTQTSRSTPLDRRNFLAILTAAGLSSTLAAPVLASLASSQDSSLIYTWDQIKPGFHALIDPQTGGNTLVVISNNKALLIDTKFAHLAGAIHQDTKALSSTIAALTLINTHHHGDHTGGNALIVPHATSYAHTNAVDRIKSQLGKFKQTAQSGPAAMKRSKGSDRQLALAIKAAEASSSWTESDITPQHAVENTKALTIADINLTMHHFGAGHTDNDLVVHFQDHNIIHTGDLVFAGLHPFFDPSAGVTARGWTKSLKSILKLCDNDTAVIPGHGPVGNKDTVQSQLDYMNNLIEHVQADIDAGVPKQETAEKNWGFMNGLGFESIRSRAISAVHDELSS